MIFNAKKKLMHSFLTLENVVRCLELHQYNKWHCQNFCEVPMEQRTMELPIIVLWKIYKMTINKMW